MKKQMITSGKTLITVMLAVVLLSIVACSGKQGNSKEMKNQSSVSQEKPKPPAMDLHHAAYLGDIKSINQHILAGSDLNIKDDYGSTALNTAAVFGKTEVALALIEGGADINLTSSDGSTALHNASFFCRPVIVKALLAKAADKEIRNSYGSTALESVAGSFEEVKPAYEQINKDLGPFGLKLDFKYLEKTRPVIADLLR